MNPPQLVMLVVAVAINFAPCAAADPPKFLVKGKTYKLTFTVPLSISRQKFPPPGPFSIVEETHSKPQKTWFVEVLDIDASGWILCDDPTAVTGIVAGSNPLIPPVWISLGAVALMQPIQPLERSKDSGREKSDK